MHSHYYHCSVTHLTAVPTMLMAQSLEWEIPAAAGSDRHMQSQVLPQGPQNHKKGVFVSLSQSTEHSSLPASLPANGSELLSFFSQLSPPKGTSNASGRSWENGMGGCEQPPGHKEAAGEEDVPALPCEAKHRSGQWGEAILLTAKGSCAPQSPACSQTPPAGPAPPPRGCRKLSKGRVESITGAHQGPRSQRQPGVKPMGPRSPRARLCSGGRRGIRVRRGAGVSDGKRRAGAAVPVSPRGHLKVGACGLPPRRPAPLLAAPRWEAADSGRLPALLAAGSGRCNVQPDM